MKGILGTKLKKAREDLGLTQGAFGRAVGLSSEYISLLESGKRRPSLETLTNLCDYLKKDISYFFREKEEVFDILLRSERLDKKSIKEIRKFQKYCKEYLYVEELAERPLESAPLYKNISAERMADEERRRLGLGNEPIRNIFSLIELNGCRVIRQPVPEEFKISGVFIFFEVKEASFVLINCTLPYGEQVFVAAHEYCHFLKDRNSGPIIDNPDMFIDEYVSLYHPREKFAHTFAAMFLMPPSKVKEIIEKDIKSPRLRFEDVIYLKRYFGVSTYHMLQTIQSLGCLSRSKLVEYQKLDSDKYEDSFFGDIADQGRLQKGKKRVMLSDRYKSLALKAYQKKKIGLDELSKLLNQKKVTFNQ
ncbi:MAG: helix-turn-helix domain-containing protein [Candidatus Aminicenantaceae bacterium]